MDGKTIPYKRLECTRRQVRVRKVVRFVQKQRTAIFITAFCFLVVTRCFWFHLLHGALSNIAIAGGLRYSPLTMRVNFTNVQFEYRLLSEPRVDLCRNKTLFVFIPSRPSAFEQREAIRQTWAHPDNSHDAAFFFVVGDSLNATISEDVEEENRAYGDLIVNDIVEDYQNLTYKTYASLEWYQTFCPEIPYALKIDDDSVVDIDRLLHFVETDFRGNSRKSMFGIVWRGTQVIRDVNSSWYVPKELYSRAVYPDYLNGPTYLATSEAVSAILDQAPGSPCLPIEDVLFTGILAARAAVRRVDKRGIFWIDENVRVKPCDAFGVPRIAAMYPYSTPSLLRAGHSKLIRVKCRAMKKNRV